ncbi:MAG: FecR family protein [Bacteroidota bacterium]
MPQTQFWNLLAKKFAGEITSCETEELDSLIQQNPDLLFTAQHIHDIWQLKQRPNNNGSEEAFANHLSRMEQTPDWPQPVHELYASETKSFFPKRKYALAAVVLVACACLVYYFFLPSKNAPLVAAAHVSEISTKAGSRTKMVLPDSSVVWLNAGSKISYNSNFGVDKRDVQLSGEAYFDVQHSTVPFYLNTGNIKIKVLGTAFNVKSYPNEKTVETSLVRGSLEITSPSRPGEKFILKPNEKLVILNESSRTKTNQTKKQNIVILSELTLTTDSAIIETAWVQNKLIFHDETLEAVARKMERWYNVRIDIKDENLTQKKVGGGPFENETVVQALTALQLAFNFNFTLNENTIVITR